MAMPLPGRIAETFLCENQTRCDLAFAGYNFRRGPEEKEDLRWLSRRSAPQGAHELLRTDPAAVLVCAYAMVGAARDFSAASHQVGT